MEDDVFTVSPQGEAQLQGGRTTLAAEDVALLVRFDGRLTWGEVFATLPPAQREAARLRVAHLLVRGVLVRNPPPPVRAAGFADGFASLRRDGFRAGIALKRAARQASDLPVNVVLVEDDPMLAHVVQTFLTLEGFTTRVAGRREEVDNLLARPPRPDLFLLDIELPDTDGFAVLRQVRNHPLLREVPAIMLTGACNRETVIRGLNEGADGYITKPFAAATLVRAVHSVLGALHEGAGGPASLQAAA